MKNTDVSICLFKKVILISVLILSGCAHPPEIKFTNNALRGGYTKNIGKLHIISSLSYKKQNSFDEKLQKSMLKEAKAIGFEAVYLSISGLESESVSSYFKSAIENEATHILTLKDKSVIKGVWKDYELGLFDMQDKSRVWLADIEVFPWRTFMYDYQWDKRSSDLLAKKIFNHLKNEGLLKRFN